ncbi:MAG: aminotransferase class V-fold PLP-dependent enzyme, partial [Oscillospiraceae bacterium]
MIYLDYAANTPTDPAVLQCFCEANQLYFGNANARHVAGFAAAEKMRQVTAGIAGLLGVLPEEIIHTSGASEANNLAIKGIAHARRHVGRHILASPLEHSSVTGALSALQQQGWEVETLELTPAGT